MNEPNKRFAQALLALASAFNAECDEMKVRAFWMGLDDIPIEKIELAVRLAMKGCKFMPTVRELRELAGEMSPEQRAIRAFDAFAGAVQSLGCYGSPDFDDRVINATVNNMGGWLRICERADEPDFDVWGRKEFERIYVSLCRTGISSEMGSRLIGYHEQQNTAAGYLRGNTLHLPDGREQAWQPNRIATGLPPHADPRLNPPERTNGRIAGGYSGLLTLKKPD